MAKNAKYKDVYRSLKSDILSERYPAGAFLPAERELMAQYGASRTTVRHAVALLREERLVNVTQGRGTQVILQSRSHQNGFALFHNVTDVSNSFTVTGEQRVSTQGGVVSIVPADHEVAQALEVAEGESVYRMERLSLVNGVPFTYKVNYLRCALVPDFDRFSGQIDKLHNLYQFLENHYGIAFTTGYETISAITAGLFDAKMLDVDIGSPLLVLKRTAFCDKGTMEYAKLLTRPDAINITVSMSGPPTYYH